MCANCRFNINIISFIMQMLQVNMAANLALLIGPSYANDLPYLCGPLEGVENDLQLMKDMLCRNGFLLKNIKVCKKIS